MIGSASATGQSLSDGEWRRKVNGITIVGPIALAADTGGHAGTGKWARAKKAKGNSKGGGKTITFGSGHGGSAAAAPGKGQGKGADSGHYKGKGAGPGGGNGGKDAPWYKPARSKPWA